MQVTGNTILITGGASGIGRALAEAFHHLGNHVIIAGRRQGPLDAVTGANPGMRSFRMDISDPAGVTSFAEQVTRTDPALNILINNAGIMKPEDLKAAIHSCTMSLRHQLSGTSIEVIEIIPPYVQTELMGGNQLADERAMPLDAFISETMQILSDRLDVTEVVVGRCEPFRFVVENKQQSSRNIPRSQRHTRFRLEGLRRLGRTRKGSVNKRPEEKPAASYHEEKRIFSRRGIDEQSFELSGKSFLLESCQRELAFLFQLNTSSHR
jgi:uncharacterized oxidoreductase